MIINKKIIILIILGVGVVALIANGLMGKYKMNNGETEKRFIWYGNASNSEKTGSVYKIQQKSYSQNEIEEILSVWGIKDWKKVGKNGSAIDFEGNGGQYAHYYSERNWLTVGMRPDSSNVLRGSVDVKTMENDLSAKIYQITQEKEGIVAKIEGVIYVKIVGSKYMEAEEKEDGYVKISGSFDFGGKKFLSMKDEGGFFGIYDRGGRLMRLETYLPRMVVNGKTNKVLVDENLVKSKKFEDFRLWKIKGDGVGSIGKDRIVNIAIENSEIRYLVENGTMTPYYFLEANTPVLIGNMVKNLDMYLLYKAVE